MRAVARPFAVALALAVLLPSASASDAAESWAAVGIQVREGRRPAAGVEVRMWPETASTAEAGALATGVTDGEGRAVLYVRPGIWRLELSTGERVDYFVTVRVGPGRRAEELGSPARDVNAPDLRWRYFVVDEPPPLELPAPIRREEPAATESAPDEPAAATAPAATEPAPDEPAAATAPADEPDATRAGDETPPADAPQPPAEADSVVPPPATPPADPVSAEPPSVPVAPEGSAPEAEPSGPADETADPTPSDSSPFDTLPRPASPYDPPPAPAVPEPVEEAEDAAPVPAEPAQPPAAVPQAEEEESETAELPEPAVPPSAAAERPPSEEPSPAVPAPDVPAPSELPVEEPAAAEGAAEEAVQPPVRDRLPDAPPVGETPPDVPPVPLPDPAPAVPPAEPVEPELPPAPPRFAASAAGECPDCRDDEASVVVERTVSPGGGACGPEIAVAALDAARRLGGGASGPRSLDADSVARWTGGEGCQLLGVVLPAGARYRGYRYEVEGGAAAGRCYAGSECPVAGAVWPDRPVIRPFEGGETVVYGLFRNTSADRARRARLTVYYLP